MNQLWYENIPPLQSTQTALTHPRLGNNLISDVGADALVQALAVNSTLTTLEYEAPVNPYFFHSVKNDPPEEASRWTVRPNANAISNHLRRAIRNLISSLPQVTISCSSHTIACSRSGSGNKVRHGKGEAGATVRVRL